MNKNLVQVSGHERMGSTCQEFAMFFGNMTLLAICGHWVQLPM
jgi:hypothetical protein